MKNYIKYILISLALFFGAVQPALANGEEVGEELNVKEFILEHLADSYEWHISTWGETHISIPLPIILYSSNNGFNVFMSSKFEHGHAEYKGFQIAHDGKYKGKIVEKNATGEFIRPWDFSLTKNAAGLLIASIVLVWMIMGVARWYKKQEKSGTYEAPKGFVGAMEMFVMSVVDDIIKPSIGKNYKKYTPYLLTAFFFIFTANILGLVPIFPGGANTTGNISVTVVLALFTFFVVNILACNKEYWKEIFWPDVPLFLKTPVMPLMQLIEIVGVFTKPFSLMIRLFANILAGHSIILGLTCLVFVTIKLGTGVHASMTITSILLSAFILLVEILVAYIQAYVFTMLSAVYIGLAQPEPHHVKK